MSAIITRRRLLQVAAAAAVVDGRVGAETVKTKGAIELYTNTLSTAPGEEVSIHVSTTARHFNLQVSRIGTEETVVWTRDHLLGAFHQTPADAWEKGCRWPPSVRLDIPTTWKSGYYQIKATTADAAVANAESLAFVVVRAARPTAKILLVLTTSTYGAYNNYGRASFYIKKRPGCLAAGATMASIEFPFSGPGCRGFCGNPRGTASPKISGMSI